MAAGEFYVYHLIDPRSDEVFYVGKGCGDRISHHETEAKKGSDHQKCEVIRSIWDDGMKVKRVKVKHFKSEQDAFDFEAEEIARVGLANLTNQQAGGGTAWRDGTQPVYAVRLMLKTVARYLLTTAQGLRLNNPWHDVAEACWPATIKRIAKERGEEFVVSELAKHSVELSWQHA